MWIAINRTKNQESGMVLVVCLILLLMLSLIGIASITTSTTDMQVAGNEMHNTGAFYAAEAGLEEASAAVIVSYEDTGAPPSPLPTGRRTLNAFQYIYGVVDLGPAVNTTLQYGSYKGLYGAVKSFTVNSTGADNNYESGVALKMGIQDALIPLFQFAAFYENDLELSPGRAMTLGGRVHSNGNIYIQSETDLYINSFMTSSGNIIHGSKPGSGLGVTTGNVFVMDNAGTYQNMKNADGTFLDASSTDWVNGSLSRWGGNVEDANHGITELYMPVVTDGPATDMIDRGAGNPDSYENKSGLKFVDGQALYRQVDGTWLDVTANLISSGAITFTTFRDSREQADIYALDLDMNILSSSGYYPPNGIIYSSQPNAGLQPALRLKNGQELPRALTVATDNPLYTIGDYNTINKKSASLIADAVTVLSNNWDDTRSSQGLGSRPATATQVNACYVTGNTETGDPGHDYNGGLENLPRFLEEWTGVTFTWRGSMAALWNSRQAISPWSYGSFYRAPDRDWAYDPALADLSNLPPGTPVVNIVMKTSWTQSTVVDFSPFHAQPSGPIN